MSITILFTILLFICALPFIVYGGFLFYLFFGPTLTQWLPEKYRVTWFDED